MNYLATKPNKDHNSMEHDLVPSNLAKVMLGDREKTNKHCHLVDKGKTSLSCLEFVWGA